MCFYAPHFTTILLPQEAITTALLATADTLGALDALVGDGDFGFTLQSGCEAMLSAASSGLFNDSTPEKALLQLSQLAENSMGGTSGNLTQEFLAAAAAAANDGDWRRALEAGADAVQAAGGAAVGDRTALDALEPAAAAARHGRSAADVATVAEEAALATQNIPRARFGRSAHVNEASLLGNADPGAMAVGVALRAFADALGSFE
jgi:triose/dihydroxyacetone kinase / FAD-AMP lyase (cyclizing)